jgi:hypothetical protein
MLITEAPAYRISRRDIPLPALSKLQAELRRSKLQTYSASHPELQCSDLQIDASGLRLTSELEETHETATAMCIPRVGKIYQKAATVVTTDAEPIALTQDLRCSASLGEARLPQALDTLKHVASHRSHLQAGNSLADDVFIGMSI